MPVSADVLRTHLDYSAWASGRLLTVAAALSNEELNHDWKTADHSILGTLVHIFGADRVWLARLHGNSTPIFTTGRDHDLAVLQTEWPALHDSWKVWATALTDDQTVLEIAYRDFRGRSWKQPVWQIILHVVNHATHHRGQVSGFLRALGHAPPPLDLSFYYRELPQTRAAG